jgi:hypothetical protein
MNQELPFDEKDLKNFPNGLCRQCWKPLDDHCFLHVDDGGVQCPAQDGETPCQKTGPAHKPVTP